MQGRAVDIANDFGAQGVANLMWALATLGEEPTAELVQAMQGRAVDIANDFDAQGVANLMWALATLGEEPTAELVQAMQDRAFPVEEQYDEQAAANILWALSVFGLLAFDSAPLQDALCATLVEQYTEPTYVAGMKELAQLHQYLILRELAGGANETVLENAQRLRDMVGEECLVVFRNGRTQCHSSRLQRRSDSLAGNHVSRDCEGRRSTRHAIRIQHRCGAGPFSDSAKHQGAL